MAAAKGMISVTLTKEKPDQKVGVELKQEKDGSIFIKKISKNGLFHGSELEGGDKVLSINGKRIQKHQRLEDYIEATLDNENLEKITIVGRKASAWGNSPKPDAEKKVFKKEIKLNPDGTPIPYGETGNEEEEKEQFMVKATKEKEGQEVGVAFVKVGDKVFVSGIAPDSIFHPSKASGEEGATSLEYGDRIAGVNDTNFMNYADPALASKLLAKKSAMECELYVEKGWNVLGTGHVDPIHYDPSLARGGKERYAGDDDGKKKKKKDKKKFVQEEDSGSSSDEDDAPAPAKKKEKKPFVQEPDSDPSSDEDEDAAPPAATKKEKKKFVQEPDSDASSDEEEAEGSGVAKPDVKDVAPPPKDDAPVDGGMWWD
mmetsp:Transcript_42764/g.103445  ORF Transcript_42764/g.103445 Transcript_42764/m.103445 type:complete len:372 (+) Transcript_42764:98-1213(+)